MNIGLMFSFRNPPRWHKPFPEFYREQFDLIREAENLGYDSVWLTEHHFSEDGYSPAMMPLAGAVANATSRVRIGTNLLLLPLHNALRLAEDVATIDILSNGRFDLGVGMGFSPREFDGFGIPLNERLSRLREGIDVLQGAWTQKDFSYQGKHYNLKNVDLQPRPVQQPHPPIWVGAMIPKSVARVARMKLNYLGGEQHRLYDETLREIGETPENYNAARMRFCYVAPTMDQAWNEAQDHIHAMVEWYALHGDTSSIGGERVKMPTPSELRNADMRQFAGSPIVGTPEHVLEIMNKMRSKSRITHWILGMSLPGLEPAKIQKSMALFAKEVAPHLK